MKRITRNLTLAAAMIAVIFAVSGCMVGKFMCNYALLPEEHGNDIEGDRVKVELSPYDLTRGRITYRMK